MKIYFSFLWLLAAILYHTITIAQEPIPPLQEVATFSSKIDTTFSPAARENEKKFSINEILFSGNKITREIILLRELPFKKGDSIFLKDTSSLFDMGKTQLLNTKLFHEAALSIGKIDSSGISIKIVVKERWYIFPFPHFKPVDRNLNQWIIDEKASLTRVDYGLKLMYNNVTGNNDNLRFYFITGFTKQLTLSYRRPFIDKSLKWGMSIDLAVGKNKQINYITEKDKQLYLKYNDYVKNFFRSNLELTYRNALYTNHVFGFGYTSIKLADTVLKLNPNYTNNSTKLVRYPEIYYELTYQKLDYIPYPTKGYAGELYVGKQGFDSKMNVWYLAVKGVGVWHLAKNLFYSVGAAGIIKVPFDQPYMNTQLLGYGDVTLKGYEYYVVDGVAGALVNASLNQRITNFSFHIPRTKWLTPRQIPLIIYAKVFGNAGYAYNPTSGNNRFVNRMLYGGGIGFDILTMYDFNLRLELSYNHLGENGIYLHKKNIFQ